MIVEAVELYDRAAEIEPDDPRPTFESGLLLLDASGSTVANREDGERRLRAVLEAVPTFGPAARRLTRLNIAEGRIGHDVVDFAQRASKFMPTVDTDRLGSLRREVAGLTVSLN